MRIKEYLEPNSVTRISSPASHDDIVEQLAAKLTDAETGSRKAGALFKLFIERERVGPTSTNQGVAFPQAVTEELSQTKLAVAVVDTPVAFSLGEARAVDVVFAVAGPSNEKWVQLKILARLYRLCKVPKFLDELRSLRTAKELYQRLVSEDERHV